MKLKNLNNTQVLTMSIVTSGVEPTCQLPENYVLFCDEQDQECCCRFNLKMHTIIFRSTVP